MRIALDPVPLVLGIYARVGALLGAASQEHQGTESEALGRRFGRQREEKADREVQGLVRSLHAHIKVADKLLKKTSDVWKISQETDLVDLVIGRRGEEETDPASYVLLRPAEIQPLLLAVRDAARGVGEDEGTLDELKEAADSMEGRSRDYLMFGFSPWTG